MVRIKPFSVALLFVVSVLVATFQAPTTSAWTQTNINCTTSPPLSFADAASTVRNQYPSGWIGGLDTTNADLNGVFGVNPDGQMFIEWNGNGSNGLDVNSELIFEKVGTQYGWRFTGSKSSVLLNSDGTYAGGTINGQSGNQASDSICLQSQQGGTYDATWTSGGGVNIGGGGGTTEPTRPDCDQWDMLCWFGSWTDQVVDGFQSFWNNFAKMFTDFSMFLADLFIPSDDNIVLNYFTDIFTALHDKLGFLTFPFDFVSSLIGGILGTWTWNSPSAGSNNSCAGGFGTPGWCTWSFNDALWGEDFTIDWGVMERHAPTVFNIGRAVAQATVVLMLIALLYKKYYSVVKS